MKKYFLILLFPMLFIGCQTVPECQKHSTSDLTMNNHTGLKLEVMLEMREPDGNHNYGTRIIEVDSYVTYKRVKEGHVRLSARFYGSDTWDYSKDTYNVRCHDHDFVWRWEYKDGHNEITYIKTYD